MSKRAILSSLTLLPSCSFLVGLVACSAAPDDAASDTSQAQVSDIASMVRLADGRYDVTCRDGHHETVTSDDILANHVCGATSTSGVQLFQSSDSCSGAPAAVVGEHTNCSALSSSTACWSVMVNGRCIDIPDTNLQAACGQFQTAALAKVQVYSSSDSCSGAVAAYLGPHSTCAALSTSAPAWSVSINGQCTDIPDTNLQAACSKFKDAGDAKVLVYASSDSCSGAVAAYLGDASSCATMSNTDPAWSVSINGQCTDIPDTNMQAACGQYHSAANARVRIFSSSDSCSGSVAAYVSELTDCTTLSATDPAWSVSVDGRCTDIPDTNQRDACARYQAQ